MKRLKPAPISLARLFWYVYPLVPIVLGFFFNTTVHGPEIASILLWSGVTLVLIGGSHIVLERSSTKDPEAGQ